ncbi:MAG: hypothetical protein KTR31_19525 [Myxococcales bacterium]|nr:hypothetical protein [Myxococcales bacterium]
MRVRAQARAGSDHPLAGGGPVGTLPSATAAGGVRAAGHALGFARAIERCGAVLAEHFPRRPDDEDELANRVVVL